MKKTITFAVGLYCFAAGAEAQPLQVRVESKTVDSGSPYVLAVTVADADSLAGILLDFDYGPAMNRVIASPSTPGTSSVVRTRTNPVSYPDSSGALHTGWVSFPSVSGSDSILILSFEALGEPGARDTVRVTVIDAVNQSGDAVETTVEPGIVTVEPGAVASAFPSPLVFASAPVNETTCDTLTVRNSGASTLTINGIYGCGALPFAMDTIMTAHSLAPGDSTRIAVCVTPTGEGPDSCEVTVVSNSINSPTVVEVQLDVVTAIGLEHIPKPFRIVSVSPNPFNPSTTVYFTLPEAMPVTVEVWSVNGARVRVLSKDQRFGPGDNRITWNGRNDDGSPAASGVYFVRAETRLGVKVARAVLLK